MTAPLTGVPVVSRIDVAELILGLAPSAKYLATDLHKRYATIARQAGREPGSVNALGRTLNNIGCTRRKMGTGNKARASWLVTGEAIMNAHWHREHGEGRLAPGHV